MGKTVKGVAAALLVLCMLCACSYVETHYTRKDCVVVETQGQLVYVVDTVGYEWCYVAEGDVPTVGTVVHLHMHTNHTVEYVYDDEVVGVVVQ